MEIFGFCGQLNSGKLIPLGRFTETAAQFFDRENADTGISDADVSAFSGSAICLGDFDGVHLGHRRLFELAKTYSKWGVLVFSRSFKNSELLTTLSEKLNIIRDLGANYAVIVEWSEKVADSTPGEFADFLSNRLDVSATVCGYDYRFGKGAEGDSQLLKLLCGERGIKTEIAEAVTKDGEAVKSTHIRLLVASGELKNAARLLGRNYSISAVVQRGLQNGAKMGFPTANIEICTEKLLPPDGVYYGKINGRDAVINIGRNLTFGAEKRTFEAHIIDFKGNIYGAVVTAELIEKIRDVMKFDNVDELIKRINADVAYAKEKYQGK